MHFLFWGESIIKIYELQSTWCWQQNQPNTHNRKKKTATKTIWAAVQSRNSSPLSVYLHWRSFYGIFQAFSSSTWAYKVRFSVISAAPAGFMHRFHRRLSHCCAPSVKTVAELTFTWKCHGLLSQTWRLRRTHDENINVPVTVTGTDIVLLGGGFIRMEAQRNLPEPRLELADWATVSLNSTEANASFPWHHFFFFHT